MEGLGHSGDVLISISTSGNSGNVVRAVQSCRAKDILTVGMAVPAASWPGLWISP